MADLKLGRKPAVYTPRRMRAMLALGAHLSSLGPPPAATYNRAAARSRLGANWYQMYGNDLYGDCVWVDSGNFIPLVTANAGRDIIVPTLANVLGAYSDATGFQPGPPPVNDEGTDENTAIAYLKATGMTGQKINDSAPVDPANIDNVKWAIALFMGVRSGILVSQPYMDAFERGEPWGVNLPPGNEGHDTRWLDYDPNGVYMGTWARDDQFVPWEKALQPSFVDELHVELWYDMVRSTGLAPNDMSLDQLDADLRAIGPEEAHYTQNVTTEIDYGAVAAAATGHARSDHWPTVRREFLALNPVCVISGTTEQLEVHHVESFERAHECGRPDLELDTRFLRTVTRTPGNDLHLILHLLDFQSYDDQYAADIPLWRGRTEEEIRADPTFVEKVKNRPGPAHLATRDDRIGWRRHFDEAYPLDTSPTGPAARFGLVVPTADEWLASLG